MNPTSCVTALVRAGVLGAISMLFAMVAGCGGGGGDTGSTGTPSQPAVTPPPPAITLVAGALGGPGNVDGPAGRFYQPNGIAVDASGNIYVADTQNHTVRKITSTGVVTLAGFANKPGAVDGVGSAARFDMPMGIAVDIAGNVYVSEMYARTIRKISPAGVVTTFAGAAFQQGYVDGAGTTARFGYLAGLAVDPAGNLYVADSGNGAVRRISPSGVVSTVAVAGRVPAAAQTDTGIGSPTGVAVGPTGVVYVVDGMGTVNAISTNGEVTILAGVRGEFPAAPLDGVGGSARFMSPVAIAVDATGNLYVVDKGNQYVTSPSGGYVQNADRRAPIRKVTPQGVVTTLPGSYRVAAGEFSAGIAVSGSGSILVSDTGKHTIVSVSQDGLATVVQGSDIQSGAADGTGSAARFNVPKQIAIDGAGNIYVADFYNKLIRKMTASGVVTTLAGKTGVAGQDDGVGAAASFSSISDIKYGIDGSLYATDEGNHLLRRISLDGAVTTVAGRNWPIAFDFCTPHIYACGGSAPISLAMDSTGSAFVFDFLYGLRKVSPSGQDAIYDCAGGCNNPGGAAHAMAFDAAGNLYMARAFAITRMSPAGIVTVVAGDPQNAGFTDGSGTSARFNSLGALALDATNNVYVADTGNNAIRKVTPAGVVTTIAGSPGAVGVSLGALPGSLTAPQGIAIERSGTLLVTTENALVRIQP